MGDKRKENQNRHGMMGYWLAWGRGRTDEIRWILNCGKIKLVSLHCEYVRIQRKMPLSNNNYEI